MNTLTPKVIFDSLMSDMMTAISEDETMAETFDRVCKFEGPFNTAKDAERLNELKERGAEDLEIRVGTLPLAIGPGLVYMYDIALEAIRARPERINRRAIGPRALRTAERLFDIALLKIGSSTNSALEQALVDEDYATRLRNRARELVIARDQAPGGGVCEFCTITYEDKETGHIEVTCPSKEQCENLGSIILLLILAWLIYEFIDWLWD